MPESRPSRKLHFNEGQPQQPEEDLENYHDETEPVIPVHLNPGHALAKAYRLIDKREVRPAVIFLDRLARQYPGWGEIDEIKALALGRRSPQENPTLQ